jgi:hypothetical protein
MRQGMSKRSPWKPPYIGRFFIRRSLAIGLEHTQAKEDEMGRNLHVVHDSAEETRCVFNALVVRNSALNAKYPGGLRAFVEKFGFRCNEKIAVDSFMGGDIDPVIEDLRRCGLIPREEFMFVDAGAYFLLSSVDTRNPYRPQPVDLGVDWLEGRYHKGGVYVRCTEAGTPKQGPGHDGQTRKIRKPPKS